MLLSRAKLLNGRRNRNGSLVLYAALKSSEGETAGKLKLVYDLVDPALAAQSHGIASLSASQVLSDEPMENNEGAQPAVQ